VASCIFRVAICQKETAGAQVQTECVFGCQQFQHTFFRQRCRQVAFRLQRPLQGPRFHFDVLLERSVEIVFAQLQDSQEDI
jgi:hypothetical protein